MRFPRWRKMTWVFLVVNALFVVWVITGINSAQGTDCANDPDVIAGIISEEACETASDVGTGIGVFLIFVLWFFVFVILSIIWLMTRPSGRTCPACGEDVKKGKTTCPKCGHDFKAAAQTPAVAS